MINHKICSNEMCATRANVKACDVCGKPYCTKCLKDVYDRGYKYFRNNVCPDCINTYPERFVFKMKRLKNVEKIIDILKEEKYLPYEERKNLIKWLEENHDLTK